MLGQPHRSSDSIEVALDWGMADSPTDEPRRGVTREQLRAHVLEQAQDAVAAGKPAILVAPEWIVELLTVATPEGTLARLGPEPIQGYSIREVARAFGRSNAAVWGWVHDGLLPGCNKFIGREWRIPLSAIETMLRAQRVVPVSVPTEEYGAWRKELERARAGRQAAGRRSQ